MIADAAILNLPKVSLPTKQLLPEYSGIYYVLDETNIVWYIGKAKNICKRWQGKAHHRIYQLEAQKKKHFTIYYERVNEVYLDSVEKQRIEKYHPHLNASLVRTKKVRPTETLLRETIVAIADFAFVLGIEPPRQEIKSQIGNHWLSLEKFLKLSVIHICLDDAALNAIYQIETIEERTAIKKKIFTSCKAYASKWENFPLDGRFMVRLFVNGYVIEVTHWERWCPTNEWQELREYIQTTLAQESIKALTPESLIRLQQLANKEKNFTFYLQRLNPYTSDRINLLFHESVNHESVKSVLAKVSKNYKAGRRGIGSRSKSVNIDQLLISRGIEPQKYSKGEVISLPRGEYRIGVYIQCFSIDLKKPRLVKLNNNQQLSVYLPTYGILDNEIIETSPNKFETVYLLAGVEKKAWLLVEEYLKDFAKPATALKNGEGYIKKIYVSARKYIAPAKVNIRLEDIGYSAWIPFGYSEEFFSFEVVTKEIRRRLENSGLPGLKIAFKNETIQK